MKPIVTVVCDGHWSLKTNEIARNHYLAHCGNITAIAKTIYGGEEEFHGALEGLAVAQKFGFAPEVYDYFMLNDKGYIIYQRYSGPDLEQYLQAHPLTEANLEQISFIINMAKNLLFRAHQVGLLHNDPNLSNFMFNDGVLHLIDFDVSTSSDRFTHEEVENYKLIDTGEFFTNINDLYENADPDLLTILYESIGFDHDAVEFYENY